MTTKERLALMDRTGVPFMSLYAIEIQTRQLGRDGLTAKQIEKAVSNLHPVLMENLKLKKDGTVDLKQKALIWQRRTGWISR